MQEALRRGMFGLFKQGGQCVWSYVSKDRMAGDEIGEVARVDHLGPLDFILNVK